MDEKLTPHQETARSEARDENGHFIHKDGTKTSPVSSTTPTQPQTHHLNPLSQFLHDETAVHKSNDDELIDIHVGNPLRKIADLLEEIKRQKAFTFDIKGSLGVAGIVLVVGTFGIFGGNKALCSKGTQTKIGNIKVLGYLEQKDETFWHKIPLLNYFLPKINGNRIVLIDKNGMAVRLKGVTITSLLGIESIIATGDFDSCSQTLTLDNSNIPFEPYHAP